MLYPVVLSAILQWMGFNAEDYDLGYDQSGALVIEAWRAPGSPPTPEEIAQEELPYLRWKRKTDARSDIENYIDGAIQPVTRSMLRDGEPVIDSATAEAVREFIADCYSAVNDFDDAVDLADLENINTVAVDLPAYVGPAQ
jgi:hypothetical protein